MPVIQVPIQVHDWTGSVIEENFVLRRGDRLAASAAAFSASHGLNRNQQEILEAEAFRLMSMYGHESHVHVAAPVAGSPADILPLLLRSIATLELARPSISAVAADSSRNGMATAGGTGLYLVLIHCLGFASPSASEAAQLAREVMNYTSVDTTIVTGLWSSSYPPNIDKTSCKIFVHLDFVAHHDIGSIEGRGIQFMSTPPVVDSPHLVPTPLIREVIDASFKHVCDWWQQWRHNTDEGENHGDSYVHRVWARSCPATILALMPLGHLLQPFQKCAKPSTNYSLASSRSAVNGKSFEQWKKALFPYVSGSKLQASVDTPSSTVDPHASNIFVHYVRSVAAHTGMRAGQVAFLLAVGEKKWGRRWSNPAIFLLDDTTWYKAARDTADIPLEALGRWTKRLQKLGLLFSDANLNRRLRGEKLFDAFQCALEKESVDYESLQPAHIASPDDDKEKRDDTEFLVLVVTDGNDDKTTPGCFKDMASTVADGLKALGFVHTSISYCALTAPEMCGIRARQHIQQERRQEVIVLAPHNLVSIQNIDGTPMLLLPPDDARLQAAGWEGLSLLPRSAVLYNFEHIPFLPSDAAFADVQHNGSGDGTLQRTRNRKGTLVNEDVLEIYRRFTIWDFSRANIDALRRHGVNHAQYVPLGYVPSMTSYYKGRYSGNHSDCEVTNTQSIFCDRNEGSIDVLFYGTATPRRLEILEELRSASPVDDKGQNTDDRRLRVVWANAANFGVFGEELDELIMDSKIVLSLLTFDEDEEWKISRFSRLLANARFIISERASKGPEGISGNNSRTDAYGNNTAAKERSFAREEEQYFSPGIIFAPRSELRETCQYFLARPEERRRIAAEGYRLFRQRSEAEILAAPVARLLENAAAN